MTVISPTITASEAHDYRTQIEQVQQFAKRLHIDLSDGLFAPSRTINPIQVWWPEGAVADVHLMFHHPEDQLETLISLKPSLVILQAEAEGEVARTLKGLKDVGVKVGVALLQATTVDSAAELIKSADHVLIFSGNLGYQGGGQVDLKLLDKVAQIKAINPSAEISWDGGVNDSNVAALAKGGIDVIYTGGFIQHADDPSGAYAILEASVNSV